jgi:hypothetical protein
VLGFISLIFIILSVIKSIISGGNVERIYAVLMLSSLIMSVTGTVFAVLGYYAEEGGITGKKAAIWLNLVLLLVSVVFLVKGL